VPEESVKDLDIAAPDLGLEYLRCYRRRMLHLASSDEGSWDLDNTLLCGLHLGLLETMQFLHKNRPSLEEFEGWILERNGGSIDATRLHRLRCALTGEPVGPEISLEEEEGLTDADLLHWEAHGYVILKGAVSPEAARSAEFAIYDYLKMDPQRPDSWYWGEQGHSIWVSMLRHPAFWQNRHSPRIAKAFAQLWGREDLWVTVDQGGFNPPERPGWQFPGPYMHWDTTLAEPHYFGVQGILYLADTGENQGAFTCIPGFHRTLSAWLAGLPKGADPRALILEQPGAKPIAAQAGDMVLWNHLLPHGSSPNSAVRPRVVQYITMKPTRWKYHTVWR